MLVYYLQPRRLFIFTIYVCYLLGLLELMARTFWLVTQGVPFFHSEQIIYVFYPELRPVIEADIRRDDDYFDVLFVGGSVLTPKYGFVETILQQKLSQGTGRKFRIFNVAGVGHTSLDSYYKYSYLQAKPFDLVVLYHGINDVRTNNAPPELFQINYSHYSWYKSIALFQQHSEIKYLAFPYTLQHAWLLFREGQGLDVYIPKDSPPQTWLIYGNEVKSAYPFEQNMRHIIELAQQKHEPLMTASFAYYVPANYSKEKFKAHELDYGQHTIPIERWGLPENVMKGLEVHAAVLTQLVEAHPEIYFVDLQKIIPKNGAYFDDICHLTYKGSEIFADNIIEVMRKIAH